MKKLLIGPEPDQELELSEESLEDPKKKKRKNGYLVGAFLLPATILFLVYLLVEVFPFGERSVLTLDLNAQYVYYFEAFRKAITEGGSLIYNWSRSLGGEFLGIFSYYLCSPFSFIVALFPKEMMTEAIFTILLCKCGMCGLFMALYLRVSKKVSSYTAILFGTIYGVCSYGVIQGMDTMWIDSMYLAPLIMLGCEWIVEKKSPLLYCITLCLEMLSCYYIGYMMSIFMVLYFLYLALFKTENQTPRKFIGAGLRFALYSLIAVAIAAILLIPAYYGLTFGKLEFQDTNYSFFQRFDFLDFLAKLLPSSYDTVRPEGLPLVYSGVLSLIFVPLFFLTPGISAKNKVGAGLLTVTLVLSMNMSTVDIFWHGLSKPNWLNYRYSFLLCAFLITLAAEAFSRLDGTGESTVTVDQPEEGPPSHPVPYIWILGVAALLFILILLIQHADYSFLDDLSSIWVALGFLGAYLLLLFPISRRKESAWRARVVILSLCAMELLISGTCDMIGLHEDVTLTKRQPYVDFQARFRPVVDFVSESDDGLYRMEKTVHKKVNDNLALGIRGISHSTSDLNASVIKILNQYGYASRSHWSKYLGGTPVSDSLLGIKYIIAEEEISDLYSEFYSNGDLTVYENPYALGVLFTSDPSILEYDLESTTTPFIRLNEIVTRMLGETETIELFKPLSVRATDTTNLDLSFVSEHRKYSPTNTGKDASLTYHVSVTNDNQMFLYIPSTYPREVSLELNGDGWGSYFGNETRRIVSLGTMEPGDTLSLKVTLKDDNLYLRTNVDYFWYLDEELFAEIMPRLTEKSAEIQSWDDTNISATISVSENPSLLLTSIPYDEGWNVEIDGEPQQIVRAMGAFVAVDLSLVSAGAHSVTMHYMPRCYIYALIISIGGILLLILVTIVAKLLRTARTRAKEIETETVSDPNKDNSLYELLEELKTEEKNPETDPDAPPSDTKYVHVPAQPQTMELDSDELSSLGVFLDEIEDSDALSVPEEEKAPSEDPVPDSGTENDANPPDEEKQISSAEDFPAAPQE